MNTIIHYEYRDGANYKSHGSWIVRGMCSQDQAAALRAACMEEDDHHFFVPATVGIPSLSNGEWDDEIDHPMCHITSIEMTGDDAQDDRSMTDLIEVFRARDWEKDAADISLEKVA